MDNHQRLTLIFTTVEMNALRQKAKASLRNPRDQARYLLRLALGLDEPNIHESAEEVLADIGAPVEAVR